jgi:hypothetical protein
MSFLDITQARLDYGAWLDAVDDPPVHELTEEQLTVLVFRIVGQHVPNLLAALGVAAVPTEPPEGEK